MSNDEITDDTPVVGAEDDALIDDPILLIQPWSRLRWVHIDGQRIAVNPNPEDDIHDLVGQGCAAIQDVPDGPALGTANAVRIILDAAGVPGLLAEIDRLKTEGADARAQVLIMQSRTGIDDDDEA